MMKKETPLRIKTIKEYHQLLGVAKPEHPLMSLIRLDDFVPPAGNRSISLTYDFYCIALKRNTGGSVRYRYGQQPYDFDEGVMFFMSPGQVFSLEANADFKTSGWMLMVHPDYLWNLPLAQGIRKYGYFGYSANEALHLSEKEEAMMNGIFQNIAHEYHSAIDKLSRSVIVAQIELLLTYAERFYQRQFITRNISSHTIVTKLETLLENCFSDDAIAKRGLPTVQYVAEALHLSPNYLSNLLTSLTGQSTQQHIHDKVIEKAKEKLSATELTVSEIAYQLGFDYPQTFSKLFKSKTNYSPVAFRQSFN